jgi:hypothetical protein
MAKRLSAKRPSSSKSSFSTDEDNTLVETEVKPRSRRLSLKGPLTSLGFGRSSSQERSGDASGTESLLQLESGGGGGSTSSRSKTVKKGEVDLDTVVKDIDDMRRSLRLTLDAWEKTSTSLQETTLKLLARTTAIEKRLRAVEPVEEGEANTTLCYCLIQ